MTETVVTTDPVAVLDTRIAIARTALRDFDKQTKTSRKLLATELESLVKARKSLRAKSPAKQLDAARQAGKENIRRVREAMVKLGGKATQAAIGAESGVGTGSLTWAIRALEESGEIKATGKRERGSREFVAKKKRTAKAGT